MKYWFLDALDARAGLAFASYRTADLTAEVQDLDANTVFIAPPDFQPETLASRVTALAAGRGSYQTGLFVENAEVAFTSLGDAVAFVRRLYVTGGGGDGAAGGGGGTPPPPVEPPDIPSPADGGIIGELGGPLATMFNYFGIAVEAASKQSGIFPATSAEGIAMRAAPGAQTDLLDVKVTSPPIGNQLSAAAIELAVELIQRCPDRNHTQDLPKWLDSLFSLQAAFDRLDIWQDLDARGHVKALAAAGNSVFDDRLKLIYGRVPFQEYLGTKDDLVGQAVAILLLTGCHPLELEQVLREPSRGLYWRRYHFHWHTQGDRYQDIARWPLSKVLCQKTGLKSGHSSLADLVCLGVGAPLKLNNGGDISKCLLLFAAMHILCDSNPGPAGTYYSSLRQIWRSSLATRSLEWLARQLPATAFPTEIEELFPQAMERQYG